MLPATDKNLRSFGYLMAGALLVSSILYFLRGNPAYRPYVLPALMLLGAFFALFALKAPRRLAPVYKAWMTMAHYMGTVMTNVVLTIFYFTILMPFTLIRFKDPLRKKLGGATYWEPHKNAEPSIERFRRAF